MVLAGVMLASCQGNQTGAGAGGKSGGAEDSGGEQSTGGKPGSGGLPGAGGMSGDGGKASGGGGGAGGIGSGGDVTGGGQGSGGLPGAGGMRGDGGKASGGVGGSGGVGSGGEATDAGRAGARAGGSTGRGGSGQADSGGQAGGSGQGGGTGGDGIGAGGSTGSASCTFTQSSKIADKIKTVGIVTWSTDLEGLRSAKIDFGLDTNYGMTAPVENPVSGENTTLLLGMKPTVSSSSPRVYHYRITAAGSGGDCVSPDYTITTGALMNALPKIAVNKKSTSSPTSGGFVLMGQNTASTSGSAAPAYIVDKDGDMVWAIGVMPAVVGVRMSYDGKAMWINCVNLVMGTGGGVGTACVHRVTMDGAKDEDLSSKFTGLTHQLTVLPDETVAYYAYSQSGDCFDIKEYNPTTGAARTIVNSATVMDSTSCHLTNIQYSKDDDTLLVSDLYSEAVAKIKHKDGSLVWRVNGKTPTISGVSWGGGNHGIHVLAPDQVLVFVNNSRTSTYGGPNDGKGDGSIALEFKVDEAAKSATTVWSYKANPGIQVDILGDLQRMPNGNTIVGYSTKGMLHEVDENGTLLEEWMWPSGATFGYIEKRATLYGPPLK
ncbi:MAG: aryl-sulfate sulfotransferase [Deltaproteobacteria bacterium]|nr:aryl-sulfate sulfotransferase [Deltaproteobacteria bacterium]